MGSTKRRSSVAQPISPAAKTWVSMFAPSKLPKSSFSSSSCFRQTLQAGCCSQGSPRTDSWRPATVFTASSRRLRSASTRLLRSSDSSSVMLDSFPLRLLRPADSSAGPCPSRLACTHSLTKSPIRACHVSRHRPSILVFCSNELGPGAIRKRPEAFTIQRALMNKKLTGAVVRGDETKPLFGVELFAGARLFLGHCVAFTITTSKETDWTLARRRRDGRPLSALSFVFLEF
mmetsp:Transcript_33792/g.66915  ORF Transcript_33792/g.66915 Transcript_33792/m.66915 type:complete len:232 (-) Transcript_33792:42-737(-)